MNVEKETIESVSDLIKTFSHSGFERGDLLLRGQTNREWEVLPSLFRKKDHNEAIAYETACLEALLKEIPAPYRHNNEPLEHFIRLQHFDISTRLLDFTYDPLIALFFACFDHDNSQINQDGKIIVVPRANYKRHPMNHNDLEEYMESYDPKTALNKIQKRIKIDDVLFVEQFIKNPRQLYQDGCFLFFPLVKLKADDDSLFNLRNYISNRNELLKQKDPDKYLKEGPRYFYGEKIIPSETKETILSELKKDFDIHAENVFVKMDQMEKAQQYYNILKHSISLRATWIIDNRKNKERD